LIVNLMLGCTNDIAHDLRTALMRVRVRLERGYLRSASPKELKTVVDQAIAGLYQGH
jgi:hypothetical protein